MAGGAFLVKFTNFTEFARNGYRNTHTTISIPHSHVIPRKGGCMAGGAFLVKFTNFTESARNGQRDTHTRTFRYGDNKTYKFERTTKL